MSNEIRPKDVSMIVPNRTPGQADYVVVLRHKTTGASFEAHGETMEAAVEAAKAGLSREVEVHEAAAEARRKVG